MKFGDIILDRKSHSFTGGKKEFKVFVTLKNAFMTISHHCFIMSKGWWVDGPRYLLNMYVEINMVKMMKIYTET